MHRSGSSLLSQVLWRNGVSIGENLVGKSTYNPDGHFEDRFVVQTNKKILIHFGGTWDRPPDLPEDWLNDPYVRKLCRCASDYRSKVIEGNRLFLFKDPRTCLLIPFWKAAFGQMLFVVIFRHPDSVVRSILKRNREWMAPSRFWWRWARELYHRWQGACETLVPIDEEQARRLWTFYNEQIVKHAKGRDTVAISYEQLLSKPRETVHFIMSKVYPEVKDPVYDMIRTDLDHGRVLAESSDELHYLAMLR